MKVLLLVAGVGSCLVAGVLLAFSSFVMSGLARIPASAGLSAMQSINVTVVNPLFMGLFMGMGVLALVVLVQGVRARGFEVTAAHAAAVVYLIGVLGVTFVVHVPMNDALATVDAAATTSVETWGNYVSTWTTWNHVRCAAAVLAGVLFLVAR